MFTRVSALRVATRKFSSALYITGDKAQSNFVVLTPHIDFDEQIKSREDLVKSIEARKLAINLDKIEKRWAFFKMIEDHKTVLEITRSEINNLISKLKKEDYEKNQSDIEKLLLHIKQVKDDLKNVKEYSYGLEETAALAILELPNLLHLKTPMKTEYLVHEFLEKPTAITESHIEIGKSQNLIKYINPLFYFLKSEGALFEFAISNYFHQSLLDLDYVQFSNADFARSIVIEGCGTNYLDRNKIFTLEDSHSDVSRLHLVGGGSLYSFMAYFARHAIQENCLPLRLFSLGRKYQPMDRVCNSDLFNLSQQSVVQVFVATEDDAVKMDETLHDMLKQVTKLYEPLGYHFRLVYVPASALKSAESLRLSIQLFSNYLNKYVEVGHLSVYDDYLSKRLLFTYGGKEKKFLKVISGEILNVQKFLGCALENNFSTQSLLLSDLLKKCL